MSKKLSVSFGLGLATTALLSSLFLTPTEGIVGVVMTAVASAFAGPGLMGGPGYPLGGGCGYAGCGPGFAGGQGGFYQGGLMGGGPYMGGGGFMGGGGYQGGFMGGGFQGGAMVFSNRGDKIGFIDDESIALLDSLGIELVPADDSTALDEETEFSVEFLTQIVDLLKENGVSYDEEKDQFSDQDGTIYTADEVIEILNSVISASADEDLDGLE